MYIRISNIYIPNIVVTNLRQINEKILFSYKFEHATDAIYRRLGFRIIYTGVTTENNLRELDYRLFVYVMYAYVRYRLSYNFTIFI